MKIAPSSTRSITNPMKGIEQSYFDLLFPLELDAGARHVEALQQPEMPWIISRPQASGITPSRVKAPAARPTGPTTRDREG